MKRIKAQIKAKIKRQNNSVFHIYNVGIFKMVKYLRTTLRIEYARCCILVGTASASYIRMYAKRQNMKNGKISTRQKQNGKILELI